MADSKDVELTDIVRQSTLKDASEAKEHLDKVLNKLLGSPESLAKLEDEFSDECREARNALRALEKAKKPETRRLIERELRKSWCEKNTSSTPYDWFLFIFLFIVLHSLTGGIFTMGILLALETQKDDGVLWTWFAIELFGASILVYGILQANKARKQREAMEADDSEV